MRSKDPSRSHGGDLRGWLLFAGSPLQQLAQTGGVLPLLLQTLQSSLAKLAGPSKRSDRNVAGLHGVASGCGELLCEPMPACSDPR